MLMSSWSTKSFAPTDTVYRTVLTARPLVHRVPPKAMKQDAHGDHEAALDQRQHHERCDQGEADLNHQTRNNQAGRRARVP
jgi:hypothetical protein